LGSTRKLGQLATVPNKIKRTKNNSYPTNPIKTILLTINNSSKFKQNKNSPQHDNTCGVTAIVAVLVAGPEICPKCKTGKVCIKNSIIKLPKQRTI
jgi:hypothetical protein